MQSAQILMGSLNLLLQHFKELNHCLSEDKSLFINNKLTQIEENNVKKTKSINVLNEIFHDLKTKLFISSDANFFECIERQINNNSSESGMQNIVSQLKLELNQCAQMITVNSQIVFSNLEFLKGIFDHLISFQKTEKNCIYDQSGNTVSLK